jgi:NAD+ synthase (glutamine-hydrolysing)
LRVAAAQINPTVGDLAGNKEKILAMLAEATERGCDLVCFPELAISGYPPEDLLLKEGFVSDVVEVLEEIADATRDCAVVVGCVMTAEEVGQSLGRPIDARSNDGFGDHRPWLANVAAVLAHGRIAALVAKRLLPNYAVFDEQRWFLPAAGPEQLFRIGGAIVGVTICEDLWSPQGPAAQLAEEGASVIVSINASPFSIGQHEARRRVLSQRVSETGAAIVYVNQVGGQDELVFDGGSMVVDDAGHLLARAPSFVEHLLVADLEHHEAMEEITDAVYEISQHSRRQGPPIQGELAEDLGEDAEVYEALVLGTRDYLHKNGFSDAVIGLSGGIDSSLVAAVAVDALGASHVKGISMPSRYSSVGSRRDAQELVRRLGIELVTVEIEPAHQAFASMISAVLDAEPKGLTDENLQSRLRGVLLMAISNDTGAIVLTTGNKSEMATGYWTLYGDSAGGFAVIKDVPKTLVYELCRYRNARASRRGELPPIPEAVLEKPPSAELRPDQKDVDSLPPYELLDPVLAAYVESDYTAPELVAMGHDPELVQRVVRLVDINEYKRRQTPPGVRISSKAFGKDRRMPITNRYRPDVEPR